ncbi:hypothetical protein GGX14DRAFT_535055 [Mycena pura]|uniref:BZIP domain-containing protein n=1 Tax=Mycena pura TaxID=153505 RepID=A0AAD6VDM6_9AGAR|nr:hypothetical protein GGX14DRAFT_535055 [Mycena pura]
MSYQYSPTQDFPPYYYCSSSLPSSPPTSVDDSPAFPSAMLKHPADHLNDTHCVPTSQLFDFSHVSPSPSECASPLVQPRLSISINPVACKREASLEAPNPKRRAGERIASKDFVPPDVTGLSKREARLVKNRAAAFLSRQRKREEFELMEVRVAELEQENARLSALAKGVVVNPCKLSEPADVLVSEIEHLRAKLQAAEERERELNAELEAKTTSRDVPPVKVEPSEPSFVLSSPSPRTLSPHKSAASLGLMVLLCALPSLLSVSSSNSNSALPASFSVPQPLPAPSSSFDFNSFIPNEYDWSKTGNSVADAERPVSDISPPTATHKLEFTDAESGVLARLGGLDISFDATPSDDGKIRVRIHPSSSASSRAPSPDYATKQESPLGMWFGSQPEPSASLSSEPYISAGYPASAGDPFLGVGGYGSPYSSSSSPFMYGQDDMSSSTDYSDSDFGVASEYSVPDSSTGGKRRVRIALKSMPAAGGEGGEWEVQFC